MKRFICFVATILIGTINCQFRPYYLNFCDDGTPLECKIRETDCVDTAGCSLPQCCGAYGGSSLAFTCTYQAKVNAQSATFASFLTGVTLTTTANDPFYQVIKMPLSVPTPTILATYDTDMCATNTGFCPQNTEEYYTFTMGVYVPFPVTSASLVAEFKAVITSGSNTLFCIRAYTRLLTPFVAELAKLVQPLSIVG